MAAAELRRSLGRGAGDATEIESGEDELHYLRFEAWTREPGAGEAAARGSVSGDGERWIGPWFCSHGRHQFAHGDGFLTETPICAQVLFQFWACIQAHQIRSEQIGNWQL